MEMEYSRETKSQVDDNELLNALKPQRNYTKEMIFAGATPLLVGFLTGGVGDAAGIAAQGIDQIRKEEREDEKAAQKTLADALKERMKLKQGGKSQLHRVYDPESRRVTYNIFRPDTEEIIPTDKIAAYAPRVQQGPEGEQFLTNFEAGAQGVTPLKMGTQNPETSQFTPYFVKTVMPKASDKYVASAKPLKEEIMNLKKADSQLSQSDLLANKMGLEFIIKTVQGSRMSDEDRKQALGHVSRIQRIKEEVESEKTKKVPERLLREARNSVKDLIRLVGNSAQRNAEDMADLYARNAQEREYLLKKFKSRLFED